MLLLQLFSNPITVLGILLGLLIGLVLHEFAHAWVADRLGDDTARLAGRLSLNPRAHLDLYGTLFLLIAGIGWGKPVPINPSRLKSPTRDEILISLSGPATNFMIALIVGLSLRLFGPSLTPANSFALSSITYINILLGIFNLLPIPPLDGSKIILHLLPLEVRIRVEQLGMYALIALFLLGQPILGLVIMPLSNTIYSIIVGGPALL